MYVQTIDQKSLAIDPGRIHAILAVTRRWWGIDEGRKPRPLGALVPDALPPARERAPWPARPPCGPALSP